ncbi:hypothetical protein JA33_259 [Dickeya phage vB_DsoM_JA33]|uniref:Uncharacterized protein n=2 Tax=Salmondvirus JA11 TaxID=2734141 RepID=A0A386K7H4_9CAUD|nr:hypothetical protein HOU32_gp258 [Dickeya phage vB_DsoM_JA11]AXG67633.1 hypothetical protein JA33_259 [Dickeya phage vB_DsoM_JA33]AYD80063.1 hypothetical protein JA11_258 [Dickeya phage vB_DsoM_JA11]
MANLLKQCERKFIFAANAESMSAMSYTIHTAEKLDCGKKEIYVGLHFQHETKVTIHNEAAIPLNGFVRKLRLLHTKLIEIVDAMRDEKPVCFRVWLDQDVKYFTSSICAMIGENEYGFVELSSCTKTIRFNLDEREEMRIGFINMALFIADLIGLLQTRYSKYFIDVEKLRKSIPRLKRVFAEHVSTYNIQTKDEFDKALEKFIAKESRGDNDATSFLYAELEQYAEDLRLDNEQWEL